MRGHSVLLMLVLALGGCGARSSLDDHDGPHAIVDDDAGPPVRLTRVHGVVTVRTGNCMPGRPPSESCRTSPVPGRVAAFEPVWVGEGYPDPDRVSRVVAETRSDEDGRFELALPAGRYTLIALVDGSWGPRGYSSRDDKWAVVEVPAEGELEHDLRINRASE